MTIYVNIWTPTTYVSDYESSVFWLQHRFINHPQNLKYKGDVPLCKCLEWPFFVQYFTMCLFSPIDHGGNWSSVPPAASWCLIWLASSSKDSYWSPLVTAEDSVPQVQGVECPILVTQTGVLHTYYSTYLPFWPMIAMS